MKYEVKARYTKLDKTEVAIQCDEPYTFIRRELPGNQMEKSDETLIQEVLTIVNMEFDPSSTLAQLRGLAQESQEALRETKELLEHTKKNSDTAQGAILELSELVYTNAAELEALKASLGHEEDEEHVETNPTSNPTTDEKGGE